MSQVVILLVSLLSAIASAQVPTSPTLKDNLQKCNDKYPVPDDVMHKLEHAKELPMDAPESVRCNLMCVAELEGFINENGSYNVEKSITTVQQGFHLTGEKLEEFRKSVEECNKLGTDYKGDEKCMPTYRTARCIQTELLALPKPN